jgi:hypothetical protein
MITLEECAQFAALDTSELFAGAVLSTRQRSLLSTYLFNLKRGPVAVRKMIVSDIGMAIDLGASKYAADLLLVLRMFLSKHPEARIAQRTPRMDTRPVYDMRYRPALPRDRSFFPGAECRDM